VAVRRESASLLAGELGKDQDWADAEVKKFKSLALQYTMQKTATEKAALIFQTEVNL
jgi:hypothetical protein